MPKPSYSTRILRWIAAWTTALMPMMVHAQETVSGRVDLELRGFPHSGLYEDQHGQNVSLAAEPEVYLERANGYQSLVITPFLRLDLGDAARTHFDVREAYVQVVASRWEVKAGLARVFWGVTESQHLVDVVNQTDLVEDPDGEDKLGQPMVHLTRILDQGALEVFVMPVFRARTYPGRNGRLRTPLVIERGEAWRHERVDLAARYVRTVGSVDLGLAHFWGTSREPRFFAEAREGAAPVLVPTYETIHQTSIDAQLTRGGWLWKLEALTRSGQGDRFYAAVGGFEYTFGNLRRSGADLGLLAEYHYDSRSAVDLGGLRLDATPFDDDLFVGTRLALNDVQGSQALGGVVVDRRSQSTAVFAEASRRVGEHLKMELEVRSFLGTASDDPLHAFRRDSYGQVRLSYFF